MKSSMAQQKTQALFNLVPAFRNDRDEIWYQYLSPADNSFLRTQRNEYHILNDLLERHRQELKEHSVGSDKHKELKAQLVSCKREIQNLVDDLLQRVPSLKAKALKAQQNSFQADTNLNQSRKRRHNNDDDEQETVTEYLSSFLPSHLAAPNPQQNPPAQQEPARPAAQQPTRATEKPSEPAQPDRPVRDTYLDGIKEGDVEVMEKLRNFAERYDCRDKILDALRRIRKRDVILDILEDIKRVAADNLKTAAKRA